MDTQATKQIEKKLLDEIAAAIEAGSDHTAFEFVSKISGEDDPDDPTWITIDCWPKWKGGYCIDPLRISKMGFCLRCVLFRYEGNVGVCIRCIYEGHAIKVTFFTAPRSSSDRLRLACDGLFIQTQYDPDLYSIDMVEQFFPLGQVVATPGALEALKNSGESPLDFIKRHAAGDWGEIDPEDREANEQALMHGARLLSAYRTRKDAKVWVITEADRSATTILLPEEY